VISVTLCCGHAAEAASMVPESAAAAPCTVVVVEIVAKRVVVSVVRGEHRSVVVAECVAPDVARVARHRQLVVARLVSC